MCKRVPNLFGYRPRYKIKYSNCKIKISKKQKLKNQLKDQRTEGSPTKHKGTDLERGENSP